MATPGQSAGADGRTHEENSGSRKEPHAMNTDERANARGMSLKVTNPEATAYAERFAGELVTEVSDDARKAIRDIITRAFRAQMTPAQAARSIRDVVGLNAQQATALENYRAGLVDQGVSPARIDTLAERFSKRMIRQRAEMIARTEISRASNRGQEELWRQAVREGRLNPAKAHRVWITNFDACDDCVAFDKTEAGLDKVFVSSDGKESKGPPFHDGCRCSQGLRVDP
jgi:hypothetical protein